MQIDSSFFICHCGNVKTHHNFRHLFEEKIKIKKKVIKEKEFFILNVEKFPVVEEKICSFPNCSSPASFHCKENLEVCSDFENSKKGEEFFAKCNGIIKHKFLPSILRYRHVKFIIPPNSVCHECGELIEKHQPELDVIKHSFVTRIIIKNLGKGDKVEILDPYDDDTKIIYDFGTKKDNK